MRPGSIPGGGNMKIKVVIKRKGLFRKNNIVELNVDARLKDYLASCASKYIKNNVIETYISRHVSYLKNYIWQNEEDILKEIKNGNVR